MSRIVRAALVETRNAYPDMPARAADVGELEGRLDDVRAANLEHHAELCAEAARLGAEVVACGELFPGPYFALHRHPVWRGLAEDALAGPTATRMRAVAREHGIVVVAPLYELTGEGRRFNTAVVIDADGEALGRYRKVHVPQGRNERGEFHETFYYEQSDGELGPSARNLSRNQYFPVFDTAAGPIGVAICYDRHFEGVMRTLRAEGARIVFSPAVTFGEKSRRMWEREFEVDAMRHRLWIGGSNRRGTETPFGIEYFGAGHFAGPDGRAERIPSRPELVVCDLDLGRTDGPDPSGWNLARDARPDVLSSR